MIEYRGSECEPFPAQLMDVKRAIQYIRAQAPGLHGDPDQLILWGGSDVYKRQGVVELESLRPLQSQMKLKRHIRLMTCRGIATPCALGLIHPTLILPEQDWEGEELTLVLTHELIHIRRFYSCIRLLSVIARVVYCFNPIVYRLEIQLNQ